MVDRDDLQYYSLRAARERELSDAAKDPTASLIHLTLAQRYEEIVARLVPQPSEVPPEMANLRAEPLVNSISEPHYDLGPPE